MEPQFPLLRGAMNHEISSEDVPGTDRTGRGQVAALLGKDPRGEKPAGGAVSAMIPVRVLLTAFQDPPGSTGTLQNRLSARPPNRVAEAAERVRAAMDLATRDVVGVPRIDEDYPHVAPGEGCADRLLKHVLLAQSGA